MKVWSTSAADWCRSQISKRFRLNSPVADFLCQLVTKVIVPARLASLSLVLESEGTMPYVIAEPCIGTKDTACVDACPVDAIQPRKNGSEFIRAPQLYIDAESC